ncbi:MAG: CinA family protein [Micrococcaceae bacterium]
MMANSAKELLEVCKQRNLKIAVAESLTGGLLASGIVDIPGASEVFELGVVSYTPAQKAHVLGVKSETIAKHGVVSSQTACEMAVGVQKLAKADCSLATTGVAGPDISEGKAAGTVFIGCRVDKDTEYREFNFHGNREKIRKQSVKEAVALLLNCLKKDRE